MSEQEQIECSFCGYSKTWKWCSIEHREEHIEHLLKQAKNVDEFQINAIIKLIEILIETKKEK